MAKSKIKAGGATRGRFKRTRMGKGWLAHRRQPQPVRPVLLITDPDDPAFAQNEAKDTGNAGESPAGQES